MNREGNAVDIPEMYSKVLKEIERKKLSETRGDCLKDLIAYAGEMKKYMDLHGISPKREHESEGS